MTRALFVALALATVGCDAPLAATDAGGARDASTDGSDPSDASGVDAASFDGGDPVDAPTVDVGPIDGGPIDGGSRYGAPVHVGTLPASGLPEISGIVASRAQPGVFWVENDSGNPADIFAIDETGALLATIHLDGATNTDWEDISIDLRAGVEEIYVADVGDNAARETDGVSGRASVRIYRLPEPDAGAGDATVTPERLTFTYPERPYDCESLFVDHRTGDVYFVTKETSPAEVFVARAPLDASATTELTHVGTIDLTLATSADMSTDGARIVVRGYGLVRVFPRDAADVAASFASPFITAMSGAAAEAIAFEHDGYGMYTVPEGAGARLFYLPSE